LLLITSIIRCCRKQTFSQASDKIGNNFQSASEGARAKINFVQKLSHLFTAFAPMSAAKRKVEDALSSKDLAEESMVDAKPKIESEQQASADSASAAGITPDQLRYYYCMPR
jgi:hypothetical protein